MGKQSPSSSPSDENADAVRSKRAAQRTALELQIQEAADRARAHSEKRALAQKAGDSKSARKARLSHNASLNVQIAFIKELQAFEAETEALENALQNMD